MSKEKMVELKIKIPERWMNFIDEYYLVTGRDRNEDLTKMVKSQIEMPMIEDDLLSINERLQLVEKYQLADIYKIPQWARDKAAGIPRKPEPAPQKTTALDPIVRKVLVDFVAASTVKGIWKFIKDATPEDIERMRAITSEEIEERTKTPCAVTAMARS